MNEKMKIISWKVLFDDFFQVDEAYLQHELPDGTMSKTIRRLNFERGDSVAALVINRDNLNCIFVRQFRYPASKKDMGWVIEIPAGIVENQESPETGIRREIFEEVGYKIKELIPIATFFTSPGGSSEQIILYCAIVGNDEKMSNGGGVVEDEESIEIIEVPMSEIDDMLYSGTICDSKTLIALQWLQLRLARNELSIGTENG